MLQKLLKKLGLIHTAYVSETDQFLQKFDREHPKLSESQTAEIEKHKNIFRRKVKDPIRW